MFDEILGKETSPNPNSKGEGTGSVQTAESKGEQKRSKQAIQAEIKSVNNSIIIIYEFINIIVSLFFWHQ